MKSIAADTINAHRSLRFLASFYRYQLCSKEGKGKTQAGGGGDLEFTLGDVNPSGGSRISQKGVPTP